MAPTDNSKWAVLRELALARFPEDAKVALMASFEMAHREESTRQFMTAEREALTAMLAVRANAAREAAHVTAEEEAARVAARAAEAALDLAARRRRLLRRWWLARRLVRWRERRSRRRRRQRKRRRRRRWHGTAATGTRTWPQRDASARSTSSPPIAATAGTWLAARLSAPARPAARAPTPLTWAGATTYCRRRQDEDGGAATTCRNMVV
jgi:hypothetical protein